MSWPVRIATLSKGGGVAWTLASLPSLQAWWDSQDNTSLTLAAGKVAAWADKSPNGRSATQATASKQPVPTTPGKCMGDGLISAAVFGDGASNSTPGKGFTCTGLAEDPDGSLWVGNHGLALSSDKVYAPAVEHYSADGLTRLGGVTMASLGATTLGSVQGVALASNGHLACAHQGDGLIYVFTKAGALVETINPGVAPNGLGYDASLDAWVVTQTNNSATTPINAYWIARVSHAILKTRALTITGGYVDHVYVEPAGDVMWIASGANSDGLGGLITKYDIANSVILSEVRLRRADCPEGIFVKNGVVTITNDAWFHTGSPALNRLMKFDLSAAAIQRQALRSQVAADTAMTFATWTGGVTAVFNSGAASVNALTAVVNGVSFASGAVFDLSQPTMALFVHTLTGWTWYRDGVAVASGSATIPTQGCVAMVLQADNGGGANGGRIFESGVLFNRNTATGRAWEGYVGTIAATLAAPSAADIDRIFGVMAWDSGLQFQLPSDHPYRLARPRA